MRSATYFQIVYVYRHSHIAFVLSMHFFCRFFKVKRGRGRGE